MNHERENGRQEAGEQLAGMIDRVEPGIRSLPSPLLFFNWLNQEERERAGIDRSILPSSLLLGSRDKNEARLGRRIERVRFWKQSVRDQKRADH